VDALARDRGRFGPRPGTNQWCGEERVERLAGGPSGLRPWAPEGAASRACCVAYAGRREADDVPAAERSAVCTPAEPTEPTEPILERLPGRRLELLLRMAGATGWGPPAAANCGPPKDTPAAEEKPVIGDETADSRPGCTVRPDAACEAFGGELAGNSAVADCNDADSSGDGGNGACGSPAGGGGAPPPPCTAPMLWCRDENWWAAEPRKELLRGDSPRAYKPEPPGPPVLAGGAPSAEWIGDDTASSALPVETTAAPTAAAAPPLAAGVPLPAPAAIVSKRKTRTGPAVPPGPPCIPLRTALDPPAPVKAAKAGEDPGPEARPGVRCDGATDAADAAPTTAPAAVAVAL
jgi:hypothetical protein